jgi:predicted acylesterase/phospholipase RssA
MENQDKNISGDFDTLVLSGGSIHSIIILGALQYATDNYLLKSVNTYIGTSAGAICSYLLAIGYDPIEIMVFLCTKQILERMKQFNIVAMINGGGATSFSHLYEILEKMTIEKIGRLLTFKELYDNFGKKLICLTHNLTKNKEEILSYETYPNMPCLIALRMSSNLPLIFEKFKYLDNFYVDGVVSNNFGIDIADKNGKKILGVVLHDINKNNNFNNENNNNNIIEYIYKIISVPVIQRITNKINNCSERCKIIILKPDDTMFFNFNLDTHKKLEMFSKGYIQMKESWLNPVN